MYKVAILSRYIVCKEQFPLEKRFVIDETFVKILNSLNVLIYPVLSAQNINEIEKECDFLIIPGSLRGVHPKYYNDTPIEGKHYDYDEYDLNKKVIEVFHKNNKPILGICGGMQEINVYFGGSLHQHIENHKLLDNSKHKIKIKKNSFIDYIYENDKIEVNSYHRQCIKKLAEGFMISATSEDNIIEAVEFKNIIGVQWHPEILFDINFFEKFIEKYVKKIN